MNTVKAVCLALVLMIAVSLCSCVVAPVPSGTAESDTAFGKTEKMTQEASDGDAAPVSEPQSDTAHGETGEMTQTASVEETAPAGEPQSVTTEEAPRIRATDLMTEARKNAVQPTPGSPTVDPASADKITDFALRLFRTCDDGDESLLISPLSVLSALGMTELGAEGETLSQMEEALGISVGETRDYLKAVASKLRSDSSLRSANSLWLRDDPLLTVRESYLAANAGLLDGDVFKAPFDDGTVEDINSWVKDRTQDRIPKILENLSPDAVVCLINALSFDAEWALPCHGTSEGIFTAEDGSKKKCDFMSSTEYKYIKTDKASGFIKPYRGNKYAFAALLPDEGVSVKELMDFLKGEDLRELLKNFESATVYAKLPKFESGSDIELSDALKSMGMTDAFDPDLADLSGIGTYDGWGLFVSRVIHKTFISVNEIGTTAGAATAVELVPGSAQPQNPKTVTLDRPFVYMIFDTETFVPVFIGALRDVK